MIPVTQTRTGLQGNCFEACLASLLDVPIYAIPELGHDPEFMPNLQKYLFPLGRFYFQLKPDDPLLPEIFAAGPTWHTMEGISPRGGPHACVAMNGKLVHDPHPGGDGLQVLECFGFLGIRL